METVGDPHLQAWFVRTRGRVGLTIVGLREARRELLAALRAGGSVGLVADRDISGGGIEVPLFGHPARLPAGPALLAIESGVPIYLAAVRRDGPGRYRGRLQRIDVPADGSRRERVTATVANLAAGFESTIADAPEQWWAVFFPIWPDLAEAPAEPEESAGAPGSARAATGDRAGGGSEAPA
jgi:KDO2-lipid IV(A) lauroyltransferase